MSRLGLGDGSDRDIVGGNLLTQSIVGGWATLVCRVDGGGEAVVVVVVGVENEVHCSHGNAKIVLDLILQ